MYYPDAVLMIFCKAPIAGQVKTRLMTALSAEQARQAHIELSEATLNMATQSALCSVQLWCAPTLTHSFFTTAAQRYALTLWQQHGADLGARMHHAFETALAHYAKAIIIGCDCPSLTAADINHALTALTNANTLVLAPAEDGGYTLIGLNKPQPALFTNMLWGTHQVLTQTQHRAAQLGVNYHQLRQQWDVDTPEDWARYRALTC